jgi:MFS family permease
MLTLTQGANRRWWALGLIAAVQSMVIMDTSIIGVALPRIQADLGFSQENLPWVFNAYVVAFGGLLLLGGRLSDLLAPAGCSPQAGSSCLADRPSPEPPVKCGSNSPAVPFRQ